MSNALDELRQKLADVICSDRAVDNWQATPSDYDLADAIIAALPGLVLPLEWEDWSSGHRLNYASVKNGYGVMQMYFPETHFRVTLRGGTIETAGTEEAAKAAAQAHYTAQIMAAFGIDGEST
ncbi:hypothetical protein [Sulfitobacter faviae]|uniref:hypothetical protein n=1 Tax=Sulfitobacter faviae TaxID=1775881 RepID=UPI00398CC97B